MIVGPLEASCCLERFIPKVERYAVFMTRLVHIIHVEDSRTIPWILIAVRHHLFLGKRIGRAIDQGEWPRPTRINMLLHDLPLM